MQHYCFIPSRLGGSDVIDRRAEASDASIPVALYRTRSAADAGEVQRLVFGLQTDDDADDIYFGACGGNKGYLKSKLNSHIGAIWADKLR